MPDDPAEEAAKYTGTRRWFAQHAELGKPGRIPIEPCISEKQYALECEHLWPNVWLMVGRVEEIAKPGQYLVKRIPPANTSIIIVRQRDGSIKCFHNVCTHRGSPICRDERGSVPAFVCPFHGFSFDLNGRLKGIPDAENFYEVDKAQYGLRQVTSDIWEGFVFVHLRPEPRETLREYLGEIGERLTGHPFHEAPYFYEYRVELRCNWKTYMYGFLENFHTRVLHKKSAGAFVVSQDNPFSHNLQIKLTDKHRFLSLFGSPEYTPSRVGAIASRFGAGLMQVGISDNRLSSALNPTRSKCWFFDINNIFPNFQLNVVNGTWYRHSFWPLAIDRTVAETRVYFPTPRNAGERFFQEYSKAATRDVLMEDVKLGEEIQAHMRSGAIDHWILSDEEIAIQHFHTTVQRYVGGAV